MKIALGVIIPVILLTAVALCIGGSRGCYSRPSPVIACATLGGAAGAAMTGGDPTGFIAGAAIGGLAGAAMAPRHNYCHDLRW